MTKGQGDFSGARARIQGTRGAGFARPQGASPSKRRRRATEGEAASAAQGVPHRSGHITPVSDKIASSGTSWISGFRSGT